MKRDLVSLFDHVWSRFVKRMEGLSDEEWKWQPIDQSKVSLEWRFRHIGDMLGEQRNADWLDFKGRKSPVSQSDEMKSAADALGRIKEAYKWWMEILDGVSAEEFSNVIGATAGGFGKASKYSYILHVADELIHHSAETALIRDFYDNHK